MVIPAVVAGLAATRTAIGFEVVSIEPQGSEAFAISFTSEAGRPYLVQRSPGPAGPWVDDVGTLVRAAGTSTTVSSAATGQGSASGFFRVAELGESYVPFAVETVDSEGIVGSYTALAFDAAGRPLVSYQNFSTADAKLARWTGAAWATETVDAVGFSGYETSIAVAPNGTIAISHFDTTSNQLRVATGQPGGWTAAPVGTGGFVGESSSVGYLPDGTLTMAFYAAGANSVVVGRNAGAGWMFETVASPVNYIIDLRPVIAQAIDPSGRPGVAWMNATLNQNNTTLEYGARLPAGWTPAATVDSGSLVGGECALAFDPDDNQPAISYLDGDTEDLKFARLQGGNWIVETVDAIGRTGYYTALAFDPDGMPAIAYSDETNRDLKFASFNGSAWEIRTIDAAGEVGRYASLGFSPDGQAVIAYYDSTNRDLKIARGLPLP